MLIKEKESLELSVIMPCLNEAEAVGHCIADAFQFMEKHNIRGEVLVVDNESEDASARVAESHGARVVRESRRGYGRAIRTGIANSRGRILIIGDADTTYDFEHLEKMYLLLAKDKCDMVIGNRFAGGIEKGAMPIIHMLGVGFLSYCGRKKFGVDVYDFHCGLRALSRKSAEKLNFFTGGMEFATEFIAVAAEKKLRIRQIPVKLRKCECKRKSKLRTVRDGLRHLRYIVTRGNNLYKHG